MIGNSKKSRMVSLTPLCRYLFSDVIEICLDIWVELSITGRLAMVAMLGIFVQASVTHVGPIDNLVQHLSDPWHRTAIQTLAGFGS